MHKIERPMRDPLFHISKRDDMSWKKRFLLRGGVILFSFLFTGILSWILIGVDPFTFIGKLFEGTFGTSRRIWLLLRNLAILLCIALALAPAFKMRFWNIGAEGQVLMGGLATAICMYYLGDKLPEPVVWLFMVVAGILAGALWAVIPAICKAYWNTNETLFTLMMNYVAIQLVSFFTNVWVKDGSGVLKNATHLNGIKLPELGNPYLLTLLVAVLLTVGMFIYLKYSKHGYELSVVGESENTARYIGINVKKVIIRTMALSGAICGITGVLLVGAINGSVTTATVGGQGFTGIIVSWLGKFNPGFMVLTSFLVIFLDRGTGQLNLTNNAFPAIVTGIVIFFIIGCEFFISYRLKFRKKKKQEGEVLQTEDAPAAEQTEEAKERNLLQKIGDGAKNCVLTAARGVKKGALFIGNQTAKAFRKGKDLFKKKPKEKAEETQTEKEEEDV
ncbi:MAG: ABC transporter permease [Clostridia bacterium]|nr:ABC transporter permease [Clostridia bacterium]